MDLLAICEALQTQLDTIAGLRASDVWPDTINCPAALVKLPSGQYHQTLGRGPGTLVAIDVEITLLIAPAANGLARAQRAAMPYLGQDSPQSIKDAVEADQTLGGTAGGVVCKGWRDFGALAVEGNPYIGVKFDVGILAS